MSQDPQQFTPEDGDRALNSGGQQQQQPQPESHAGQGSESIMKRLREWEQGRASNSGGRRGSPN